MVMIIIKGMAATAGRVGVKKQRIVLRGTNEMVLLGQCIRRRRRFGSGRFSHVFNQIPDASGGGNPPSRAIQAACSIWVAECLRASYNALHAAFPAFLHFKQLLAVFRHGTIAAA